MSRYIGFPSGDGSILLEVGVDEIEQGPGMARAGLLTKKTGDAVATAEATFETAVSRVLGQCASALDTAVEALPRRPDVVELTFALKATGEVGNLAIAKVGGEANFTLRLSWSDLNPQG